MPKSNPQSPTDEYVLQACPILAYGTQIEVRPIAELCRPMTELQAMAVA